MQQPEISIHPLIGRLLYSVEFLFTNGRITIFNNPVGICLLITIEKNTSIYKYVLSVTQSLVRKL